MCFFLHESQESDGEKSDDNLVVDVSNEVLNSLSWSNLLYYLVGRNESWFLRHICAHPSQDPASPRGSPAHSPRENGLDKNRLLKKDAPLSPSSIASSSSTPSSKSKENNLVSQLGNENLLIFLFTYSQGDFLFSGIKAKITTHKSGIISAGFNVSTLLISYVCLGVFGCRMKSPQPQCPSPAPRHLALRSPHPATPPPLAWGLHRANLPELRCWVSAWHKTGIKLMLFEEMHNPHFGIFKVFNKDLDW